MANSGFRADPCCGGSFSEDQAVEVIGQLDASKNCRILMSDGGTDVRAGFGSIFWGDFMSPLPLGGGYCTKQALKIMDKVGHTDLDGGAGDADGAHDKAHAVLLPGEHMLDLRGSLSALYWP